MSTMFREVVTAILAILLVGGLVGRLVLISIAWIKKLYSLDKMYGVFFVHVLLIFVLLIFGLFIYWILQPLFVPESISEFMATLIYTIIIEMTVIFEGYYLLQLFEQKEAKRKEVKEDEKK